MAIQTILGTDAVKTTGLTKINNNFSELNTTTVKITGAQTIAGVKTFSDNIIASSNVGIGTTSPGYKLDISGTSSSLFKISNGNGAKALINCTIGEAQLDLQSGGQFVRHYYRVSDGRYGIYMPLSDGTTYLTRFSIDGSGNIAMPYGNVGIGTTSPGSRLSVVGLPTSASGLSTGDFYTQTATQLGGSGTTKVVCVV